MLMSSSALTVEGDFGEGAFGPTILLRPATHQAAAVLRDLFSWLASQPPGTAVELTQWPGFRLSASIWSFTIAVRESSVEKRLFRDTDGGFSWSGTREEWKTTALLVDSLTRQTGHQYLTNETVDDAIVEVSCGEA